MKTKMYSHDLSLNDENIKINKCLAPPKISPVVLFSKAKRKIENRILKEQYTELEDEASLSLVNERSKDILDTSIFLKETRTEEQSTVESIDRNLREHDRDDENSEDLTKAESLPLQSAKGPIRDQQNKKAERIQGMENAQIVFTKIGNDSNNMLQLIQQDSIPYNRNENHVIVKVEASTISLEDIMIRKGEWLEKIQLPYTPGHNVVGRIVRCGLGVKNFVVGDRVGSILKYGGGNARYVSVDSQKLLPLPKDSDASQLACLISDYTTAFQSLISKCPKADDKPYGTMVSLRGKVIVVTNAASPVGRALVEMAKMGGAELIYGSSENSSKSLVQNSGGIWIPDHPSKWLSLLKGKCDMVIDLVCHGGYNSCSSALNQVGHLIIPGQLAAFNASREDNFSFLGSQTFAKMRAEYFTKSTFFYDLFDSFENSFDLFKRDFDLILGLFLEGRIRPKVGFKAALSEVEEVYRSLENGSNAFTSICLPYKRLSKEWVLLKEAMTSVSDQSHEGR